MADTTPSDLAVAFRSFARRLQDILSEASGDRPPPGPHRRVDATVNDAADRWGQRRSRPPPARRSPPDITATPADKWDDRILGAVGHQRPRGWRSTCARSRGGELTPLRRRSAPAMIAEARPQPLPQLSGVVLHEVLDARAVDRVDEGRNHYGESAGPRPSSTARATSGGCGRPRHLLGRRAADGETAVPASLARAPRARRSSYATAPERLKAPTAAEERRPARTHRSRGTGSWPRQSNHTSMHGAAMPR